MLIIAETKIDASFPTGQFAIEGFATPFRLDRNVNGGGLLAYVRSDHLHIGYILSNFPMASNALVSQ